MKINYKKTLFLYLYFMNAGHSVMPENNGEKGITMVTALYDIGRGNWTRFTRSFDIYLSHFVPLLRLDVNLVVFCENKRVEDIVRSNRKKHSNTRIKKIPFEKLEFYHYQKYMQHVLETDEFQRDNELLNFPESFSVKYLVLMNNKISFLKKVQKQNPFNSSHFFWMDAGYGHGTNIFPSIDWTPEHLLGLHNKITFIQLADDLDLYRGREDLHKVHMLPAISGGFFGGSGEAVTNYYHLYRKVFRGFLVNDVIDDDQSMALYCYFEYPSLFHFVKGDWFDAFKLFG